MHYCSGEGFGRSVIAIPEPPKGACNDKPATIGQNACSLTQQGQTEEPLENEIYSKKRQLVYS